VSAGVKDRAQPDRAAAMGGTIFFGGHQGERGSADARSAKENGGAPSSLRPVLSPCHTWTCCRENYTPPSPHAPKGQRGLDARVVPFSRRERGPAAPGTRPLTTSPLMQTVGSASFPHSTKMGRNAGGCVRPDCVDGCAERRIRLAFAARRYRPPDRPCGRHESGHWPAAASDRDWPAIPTPRTAGPRPAAARRACDYG
jgi:hypothetical protein